MTVTIEDTTLNEELTALSDRLGKSVDEIVRDAVEEKIRRLQTSSSKKIDWAAVRLIQDRATHSPVLLQGTPNDLLGYNERGTFD